MEIIEENQYVDSVNKKLESIVKELGKGQNKLNGLVIQSINGIHITDLKKLEKKKDFLAILNDLQKIHKKNNINLIINDQNLIKQNYIKGNMNLLFFITLPQIIFQGEKSSNWILNSSLNKVKSMNTSIFKIGDLLFYVISL